MKHLRFSRLWLLFGLIITVTTLSSLSVSASAFPDALTDHSQPDISANGQSCPSDPVRLTWFYKPPRNTSIETVASHFDHYILTKNDEKQLAQLHSAGEGPVLQYLHWDSVDDPCFQAGKPQGTTCHCGKNPLNNQVAWLAQDICWIRDHHPEWFLRDSSGNLIYYKTIVMIDPGAPGWLDFFIERMKQSQADGWDGVFFDNLATRFGAHAGKTGIQLQQYPTLEAYQQAVISFLAKVNQRYFEPQRKPLYANVSVRWGENAIYFRYLDHLDGVMDEFWAVPRSGYYSVKSWEDRLLRIRETLKRGKTALLVAQGNQSDNQRERFTLASYLLVASDRTFFRYTSDTAYNQAWLYDNYRLRLGKPLADYTRQGTTWSRRFANGEVRVNPENHTASIRIFSCG